jgi:hypothetical protein
MKIKCIFAPLKNRLLSLNLEKEKLIENQSFVGEDKACKQKNKRTKWTH